MIYQNEQERARLIKRYNSKELQPIINFLTENVGSIFAISNESGNFPNVIEILRTAVGESEEDCQRLKEYIQEKGKWSNLQQASETLQSNLENIRSLLLADVQESIAKLKLDNKPEQVESHNKIKEIVQLHIEDLLNRIQLDQERIAGGELLYQKLKADVEAFRAGHVGPIEGTQTYKFLQELGESLNRK